MEHPIRLWRAGVGMVALVSLWLSPVPARASTVGVSTNVEPVFGDEVLYTAAPGERNAVSLRVEPGLGSRSRRFRHPHG